MNEETAVSLTLVLGHRHDARNVVLLLTQFLLGKIADQMTTLAIVDCQDVEQERLHVIVKRFVIEEEFGQQAEVLTINLIDVAIHLENGEIVFTIDFSGRWMSPQALGHVPIQYRATFHVLETEFAQEQFRKSVIKSNQ